MRERAMRAMAVAAIGLALGAGCTETDLYAPCDLDANSSNPQTRRCAQEGTEYSCAISNYLQCETRTCARFEGSDAFCTLPCGTDDDCAPGGKCIEFIIQSGDKYCVED